MHGGNGADAVRYLARVFGDTALHDPYAPPERFDMAAILNISRRDFLKTSGAASALVMGAHFVPGGMVSEAQAQAVAQPNLFVSIAGDGLVTITCSRAVAAVYKFNPSS